MTEKRAEVKSVDNVAGKIDMNTGVTLAVLIAIVGAAWTGSQRLTKIEENIEQLQIAQASGRENISILARWQQDHDVWASTEAARTRAALNEVRREVRLPAMPYADGTTGGGFQPADRHRKPATGEPR